MTPTTQRIPVSTQLFQVDIDSAESTPAHESFDRVVAPQPLETRQPLEKRPLEKIVRAICEDAREGTSHYLLRSNTSHDGE